MKRILILEDNVKTLTSLEKMIREISPEIITFPVQTYEEACICAVKQQIDGEIMHFFEEGYSRKDGHNGLGLYEMECRFCKKYS